MFRIAGGELEFLLVHPGGPFWRGKDAGAWTIPKGEVQDGEDPFQAAQREFREELGFSAQGPFVLLTPVKQKAGKLVHAWAFEGDVNTATCRSNVFRLEWPPRSGTFREFPEVDQVAFFGFGEARRKINPAQVAFLTELKTCAHQGGERPED